MIAELINLITEPDDIILDFFAGSGSTGHAVMKLNLDQGSKRRFVLVQIPESTGRTEYITIADITKKRLRESYQYLYLGYEGGVVANNLVLGFNIKF